MLKLVYVSSKPPFERRKPRSPVSGISQPSYSTLPPVVRKVWRLHELWPIRAAVVEALVDRLLKS